MTSLPVAYAGEPGAFAEEAVLTWFDGVTPQPVPSFRAVFDGVRSGAALAGVVPVESSRLGTIRETLDLLFEDDLAIVGEVTVPVRLALLGLPGDSLEDITEVRSIAAALAQADDFLRARSWTVHTTYNTAGAAKEVAERGRRGVAAVAASRVAELYGLRVLADGIQSGDDNRTRFSVIGPAGSIASIYDKARPAVLDAPKKTTIVFGVRNAPGSLHRSLGTFASRGINLSRLESRPWAKAGARWEYVFWADLDADAGDEACAAALADLAHETEVVRVLGTYPRPIEE